MKLLLDIAIVSHLYNIVYGSIYFDAWSTAFKLL